MAARVGSYRRRSVTRKRMPRTSTSSYLPSVGARGVNVTPETSTPVSASCAHGPQDRKSTRLNSSHVENSYAVFCLKKKKNKNRCSNRIELIYRSSNNTSKSRSTKEIE